MKNPCVKHHYVMDEEHVLSACCQLCGDVKSLFGEEFPSGTTDPHARAEDRKRFDPTDYKIIIQRVPFGENGDGYFSGRVEELPDVEVFTASPESAYRQVCMVIAELQEASANFPQPSGREE